MKQFSLYYPCQFNSMLNPTAYLLRNSFLKWVSSTPLLFIEIRPVKKLVEMNLRISTLIVFLITILPMKFTNSESKCKSRVCIPDNYDKTIEPFQNEITNISVQFSEIKVVKVDDEESTITLSLSLSLIWMDPRLNVDVSLKNKTLTILSTAIMDKIWIPTSYMIVDLKQRKPIVHWISVLKQKYFIATYGIEIDLQCSMTFDDLL